MTKVTKSTLSNGAIDKLGERLRLGGTDADFAQLTQWREAHFAPLQDATALLRERLRAAGEHQFSSRVKTEPTILDKIRREPGMRLSRMQDVAGIRIVVNGTRKVQDSIVNVVGGVLPQPRVMDRRDKPTHGYRAVHVVVKHQGMTIEVQVRTDLQHFWAESMEKLGDKWGRQIRYGGLPDEPDRPIAVESIAIKTRRAVIEHAQTLASLIDQDERLSLDYLTLLAMHEDYEQSVLRIIKSGAELTSQDAQDVREQMEHRLSESRTRRSEIDGMEKKRQTRRDEVLSLWREFIDRLD